MLLFTVSNRFVNCATRTEPLVRAGKLGWDSTPPQFAEKAVHHIGKPDQHKGADCSIDILVDMNAGAGKEAQQLDLIAQDKSQDHDKGITGNLYRPVFRYVFQCGQGKYCHRTGFNDNGDNEQDENILDQDVKFHISLHIDIF